MGSTVVDEGVVGAERLEAAIGARAARSELTAGGESCNEYEYVYFGEKTHNTCKST